MTLHTQITGAVARGWCHPDTSHKEMDTVLAERIIEEVMAVMRPIKRGYRRPVVPAALKAPRRAPRQ